MNEIQSPVLQEIEGVRNQIEEAKKVLSLADKLPPKLSKSLRSTLEAADARLDNLRIQTLAASLDLEATKREKADLQQRLNNCGPTPKHDRKKNSSASDTGPEPE